MSAGVRAVVGMLVVLVLALAVLVGILLARGDGGEPEVRRVTSSPTDAVTPPGTADEIDAAAASDPAQEPSGAAAEAPGGEADVAEAGPADLAASYARVRDGVVRVDTLACTEESGRGSGFLVAEQLVVTNAHVVTDARHIAVTLDDGLDAVSGRVIAIDDDVDLALVSLSTPDDGHVFALADGDPAELQDVATIGYPRGERLSVSDGVVSGLGRELDGLEAPLIQTDASMNPGSSGGPLIDARGRVVGVSVAGYVGADGLNYAIPVSVLRERLDAWTAGQDTGDVSLVTCEPDSRLPTDDTLIVDQVGTDRSAAVVETLQQYFDGINEKNYEVAWAAFSSAHRAGPDGDPDTDKFDSFRDGVSDSKDFAIVLRELTSDGEGTSLARVTFTSFQPPRYAPDGESECVEWHLYYPLVDEGGRPLLGQTRPVEGRGWEPCPG